MIIDSRTGLAALAVDEELTTEMAASIINNINQRFGPYYENTSFEVKDLNHCNIDFIIMACRLEDDEWKSITEIIAGFNNGVIVIDPNYKDVFSQVVNLN